MIDCLQYQDSEMSLQEREAVAVEMLTCLDRQPSLPTYPNKTLLAATVQMTSGIVGHFTLFPIRNPERRLMIWDVVPVAYLTYFGGLKPVQYNRHLLQQGCHEFSLTADGIQYFSQHYDKLLSFVDKVVHIDCCCTGQHKKMSFILDKFVGNLSDDTNAIHIVDQPPFDSLDRQINEYIRKRNLFCHAVVKALNAATKPMHTTDRRGKFLIDIVINVEWEDELHWKSCNVQLLPQGTAPKHLVLGSSESSFGFFVHGSYDERLHCLETLDFFEIVPIDPSWYASFRIILRVSASGIYLSFDPKACMSECLVNLPVGMSPPVRTGRSKLSLL